MRRNNIARMAIVLLAWPPLANLAGAVPPPVWKFTQGDTSHYRLIQKVRMATHLGGVGQTSTCVEQTIDMVWQVRKVRADASAVVDFKIERLQLQIDGPGKQTLRYDSAAAKRPQGFAAMVASLFGAMTETSYQFTITPQGKITGVIIPEAVLESVRDAPGGEMMGSLASEAGFKNLLQQTALILPETTNFEPGQQWSHTVAIDHPAMGGKQTAETTYCYEGIEKTDGAPLDSIALQTAFDFGNGVLPTGGTIKIAEQQSTGKVRFDRAAGKVESSANRQTIKLEIATAEQTAGQTIEQVIEQTVEFQLVK